MHIAQDAVIISLPTIVKASTDAAGNRVVECEVSNEECDSEGDVIEQKALMDSADSFLKNGHIDLDHGSELHHRLGLPGIPSDWIIGYPKAVNDLGDGRTGVRMELLRETEDSNGALHKAESVWRAIKAGVRYRASIYGFPKPGMVEDCRGKSRENGARRFHISGMDWKSLALTTSPVNDAIEGFVKIVSAKAFVAAFLKSSAGSMPPTVPAMGMSEGISAPPLVQPLDLDGGSPYVAQSGAPASPSFSSPRNLSDAVGQYHTHIKKDCPHSGGLKSTPGFSAHFQNCCGMAPELAELFAHALMHELLLSSRRAS